MKPRVFELPNIASKLFAAAAVASVFALAGCQSRPLLLRNRPNVPPPLIDPDDVVEHTNVADNSFDTPPPFQMEPTTIAPATPPTQPVINVAPLTYTVKKRDSFWKIARMYGVSQQELASYNNMSLRAPLKVNTKLLIPPGGALKPEYANMASAPAPKPRKPRASTHRQATQPTMPTTSAKDGFYIVQPRDSLWKIARRNHVPLKELEKANNLNSKSIIRPGMRLVIPGKTAATAPTAPDPYAPLVPPKGKPASYVPDDNRKPLKPAGTTIDDNDLKDAVNAADKTPSDNNVSGVFDDDIVETDDSSLNKAAKIAENASKIDEYYTEQILPSDTLEDIASRNGTTPEEIRALNPQIPPSGKLKPFTEIRIRKQ